MGEPAIKVDFEQIMSGVSKVKLRGGVVGKVCTVLLGIAAATAAISWAAHSVWVCVLALILLFGMSFPLLWRLLTFADKHPEAALFEGAEFLAHKQMQMGMKTTPVLPDSSVLLPPPAKPLIPEATHHAALPDTASDV